jgi:hypothetical protein
MTADDEQQLQALHQRVLDGGTRRCATTSEHLNGSAAIL